MAFVINLGDTSAATPFEANNLDHFQACAEGVLDYHVNVPMLPLDINWEITGEDSAINALARLARGGRSRLTCPFAVVGITLDCSAVDNVAIVNTVLANTQVHGLPGTDINQLLVRHGDWDMTVKTFVTLMYL